jgi:glycerate kinase
VKILIATDSFKGCCSTLEAANEFKKGVLRVFPGAFVTIIPVADGGEGTVDAVIGALGGSIFYAEVTGPLGESVTAAFGLISKSKAVIEMAAASGLTLVKEKDPLRATTYGTGQLIAAALGLGCADIFIGIGGSATNDGGAGMAQALGARFLDQEGNPVPLGGGSLHLIDKIDISGMDNRLKSVNITVMSDVTNPLCGEKGASEVFGPQKGATPGQVKLLDSGLYQLAGKTSELIGADYSDVLGAGAAGGLGFGLMAFAGASMRPGIETVLDIAGFDRLASEADLIITGEGSLDGQSVYGKAPVGIARRAKKYGKPVVAIAGGIGEGAERVYGHGIDALISSTCRPMSVEEAVSRWDELLADAAERAMRLIKTGIDLKG